MGNINAHPNISRIKRALSPMYLSTIADATTYTTQNNDLAFTLAYCKTRIETLPTEHTFRKDASMLFATALASNVLPVPGGPYKSTPFGACA